jgi:hypothetical protein
MLAFFGSVLAVGAMRRAPIPGVADLAQQAFFPGVLLDVAALLALVRVWAALSAGNRGVARRSAAIVYVAGATLATLSRESVFTALGAFDTAFRFQAVAVVVAFAGLLWVLADALRRSGRLHGAGAIYGIALWFWVIELARERGALVSLGEIPWWAGFGEVGLLVLPIAAVLAVQLARPNGAWPLVFPGGLELWSGLDLAIVALGAGTLFARPLAIVLPPWAATAALANAAVAAAIWVYLRRRSPGDRELRLAVPLVLLPSMAFAAAAAGFYGIASPLLR